MEKILDIEEMFYEENIAFVVKKMNYRSGKNQG
jgi:hypothetical protein